MGRLGGGGSHSGHIKVESVILEIGILENGILEIGILENGILEIGILENELVGILCPTQFRLSCFLSPQFSQLQPFHWTYRSFKHRTQKKK